MIEKLIGFASTKLGMWVAIGTAVAMAGVLTWVIAEPRIKLGNVRKDLAKVEADRGYLEGLLGKFCKAVDLPMPARTVKDRGANCLTEVTNRLLELANMDRVSKETLANAQVLRVEKTKVHVIRLSAQTKRAEQTKQELEKVDAAVVEDQVSADWWRKWSADAGLRPRVAPTPEPAANGSGGGEGRPIPGPVAVRQEAAGEPRSEGEHDAAGSS